MTPCYYQHLTADNDTNGNPRRLYLVIDHDGAMVAAIDEGYLGKGAIAGYDGLRELPELKITPRQYRDLRRAVR